MPLAPDAPRRHGHTPAFWPRPVETSVSVEVREDFEKFARGRGYQSSSDCLRELVLVAMHGAEFLTDLHRERIASLVRNRTETGLIES